MFSESSVVAIASQAFLRPIAKLLDDPTITEVMINGPDSIYVERKGRLTRTDVTFESDDQLMAMVRSIAQFVGRRIDEERPILDARLPDGSRIHVVIPPVSKIGTVMSIRKFSNETMTMKDLIEKGALTVEMARFIHVTVQLKKNLVVSGGTSSGKTTLLNVISAFIPEDQRIVVIEDSSELQLKQAHQIRLETREADRQNKGQITIRDLVKSSLRLRPDRIIIGEVRGEEALDLIQAMNTGHSGSMATLHANNPRQALNRIETMVMMSKIELPLLAIRNQIASSINLVIQAERLRDGARKITAISELVNLDAEGNYILNDLFRCEILKIKEDGELLTQSLPTGTVPSFMDDARRQGLALPEKLFHRPPNRHSSRTTKK